MPIRWLHDQAVSRDVSLLSNSSRNQWLSGDPRDGKTGTEQILWSCNKDVGFRVRGRKGMESGVKQSVLGRSTIPTTENVFVVSNT